MQNVNYNAMSSCITFPRSISLGLRIDKVSKNGIWRSECLWEIFSGRRGLEAEIDVIGEFG